MPLSLALSVSVSLSLSVCLRLPPSLPVICKCVDQDFKWKCPKDDDLCLTSAKSEETQVEGEQRERLSVGIRAG